jgi:8-oxo-dGTP diphosphatase
MNFMDYDTRLAAYAVITDDADHVLLVLWNEGPDHEWTMPGGGVELYESTDDAVVREVEEETGYVVRLGPLLGVNSRVIPAEKRYKPTGRPLKGVRVIYRAEIIGGALRNEVDGTTDEARWFGLDDVASLSRVTLVDRALELAGLISVGDNG